MNYPSVTQIIGRYSDFSRVPPDVLEAAKERGTRVHQVCAAMASGLWVPDYCDSGDAPYIVSFEQWFEAVVDNVIAVEPELTCTTYRFKGHPDLLCRLKGDDCLTLIDLKSPVQKQKTWRLQIAAYRHLALKKWPNIARVGSLRLSPEGRPALFDEYSGTLDVDFNVFVSALNVHNFLRKE